MDACYSGLLTATRAIDNKPRRDLAYLKEITKERVRQVLTAGGKDQEVLDGGPKGHSVFIRTDEVIPEFILYLLRSKQFFDLISEQKNNGIKNEQGADFLGELQIPLPPLEEQQAIVAEIERQRAIIAGVGMVLVNWRLDSKEFSGTEVNL
jgi:hypothetical protein